MPIPVIGSSSGSHPLTSHSAPSSPSGDAAGGLHAVPTTADAVTSEAAAPQTQKTTYRILGVPVLGVVINEEVVNLPSIDTLNSLRDVLELDKSLLKKIGNLSSQTQKRELKKLRQHVFKLLEAEGESFNPEEHLEQNPKKMLFILSAARRGSGCRTPLIDKKILTHLNPKSNTAKLLLASAQLRGLNSFHNSNLTIEPEFLGEPCIPGSKEDMNNPLFFFNNLKEHRTIEDMKTTAYNVFKFFDDAAAALSKQVLPKDGSGKLRKGGYVVAGVVRLIGLGLGTVVGIIGTVAMAVLKAANWSALLALTGLGIVVAGIILTGAAAVDGLILTLGHLGAGILCGLPFIYYKYDQEQKKAENKNFVKIKGNSCASYMRYFSRSGAFVNFIHNKRTGEDLPGYGPLGAGKVVALSKFRNEFEKLDDEKKALVLSSLSEEDQDKWKEYKMWQDMKRGVDQSTRELASNPLRSDRPEARAAPSRRDTQAIGRSNSFSTLGELLGRSTRVTFNPLSSGRPEARAAASTGDRDGAASVVSVGE